MFFRLWVRAPRMTMASFDEVKGNAPGRILSAASQSPQTGSERNQPFSIIKRSLPLTGKRLPSSRLANFSTRCSRSKKEEADCTPCAPLRMGSRVIRHTGWACKPRVAILGSQSRFAQRRRRRVCGQSGKLSRGHLIRPVENSRETHQHFRCARRALVCTVPDRIAVLAKIRTCQREMLKLQVRGNIVGTS